ncbi:MAG: hypothetical protein QRY72_01900 [Candidatus Rhabdochlamydia sp.]
MTIRPLSSIIESLTESTSDPIFHDCLTDAVTLFPCGHNVNEDVAESSMKKRKICPIDNHPITGYAVNQTLRKIAQDVKGLTPDLNRQLMIEHPLESPVRFPQLDIAAHLSLKELKNIPIVEFEKRLRQEPFNGGLYRNFARMLSKGMALTLNHELFTRELLCKKAIELNDNDAVAYRYLAEILEEEKKDKTKMGEQSYGLKDLYLIALQKDPNDSRSYVNLGKMLAKEERVTLIDADFTQQQLYMRAITQTPTLSIAYVALGDVFEENSVIEGLETPLCSKKMLYLKALELNPDEITAYTRLADTLAKDETVTLHQEVLTPEQLYLKAIEYGVDESKPYFQLAKMISSEGILFQGTVLSQEMLYKQGLERDHAYPEAFFQLAVLLKHAKTCQIGSKSYTKKQLLCEAMRQGFVTSLSYVMLADLLDKHEKVILKTSLSKKELYLEAMKINEQEARAYVGLGSCMNKDSRIVLHSGRKFSQLELYLEAIRINPEEARGYVALGKTLLQKEMISVQKIKYSKEALYQHAIEIDPSYDAPYLELACQLDQTKTFKLKNGKQLTKKELLIKTLECNPYQSQVYGMLAAMIQSDETVQLKEDTVLTKKLLYCRAIELSDTLSSPYFFELAELLTDEESVILFKKARKKRELYLDVIELNPYRSLAYRRLADLLGEDEKILSLKGQTFTASSLKKSAESVETVEVYIQEIDRAIDQKEAYLHLAECIGQEEFIELMTGEKIDRKGLYVKCLDLDPTEGHVYIKLAALMKKGECIKLLNQEKMLKEQLYYKGMEHLRMTVKDYHEIALTLPVDEALNVTIQGKLNEYKTLSRKELYLEAIRNHPENGDSYCYLADHLGHSQINIKTDIHLLDGTRKSRKDLYQDAIALKPEQSHPYLGLAIILGRNDKITVGEKRFSKQELCLESLKHIKKYQLKDQDKEALAYYYLASTLIKKDEKVQIGNHSFSKEKLYCKVLELNREYGKAYERLLEIKPALLSVTLEDGTKISREELLQLSKRYKTLR